MALQLPRVFTPPLRDLDEPGASWGHDFIWFCEVILRDPLSDWQSWLAVHVLEVLTKEKAIEFAMFEDDPAAELAKVERLYGPPEVRGGRPIPNGRLRFAKIVILIARQNGKTDFVKKLIKWLIFRKRVVDVLAAAQTLNKAIDLWNEILLEIERAPKLKRMLGRVDHSKGGQAMWTRGKLNRYRPVGIDENAGRGDTVDFLYIDELRTQKDFTGVNALEATTTVPDNGLLMTTSNAGSDHSVVLKEYRDLAMKPIENSTWEDTRLGLFEWSADPAFDIDDERGWRQANPDLSNGRITMSTLRAARESTPVNTFRTERLCQWVDEIAADDFVPLFPYRRLDELTVSTPVRVGERVLAVEVSTDRKTYSVAAAGQTTAGLHLQALDVDAEFDVDEVVAKIARAVDAQPGGWDPAMVVLDKDSAASVLVPALLRVGIAPVALSGGPVSLAYRGWLQGVADGRITFDASEMWLAQLKRAKERTTSAGKFPAIDRYSGEVSLLVAATFAAWGLTTWLAGVESGQRKAVESKPVNPLDSFPMFKRKKLIGGVLVA